MIGDNRRLLVDWDDDGFFNLGTAPSTPDNLTPAPLTPALSGLRGAQYTTGEDFFEDEEDVDTLGFFKRSIKFGKTASEDYAEKLIGTVTFKPQQRRRGDAQNRLTNSSLLNLPYAAWTDHGTVVGADYRQVVLTDGGYGGYYESVRETQPTQATYFVNNYLLIGGGSDWETVNGIASPATLQIPVVPGQTYTIVYWARLLWNAGNWTGNPRVYYDTGTYTTSIGLSYSEGFGASPANKWIRRVMQFTAPGGVTAVGFAVSNDTFGKGDSAGQTLQVAGVMLFDGLLSTFPDRFWDDQVDFSQEQFPNVIEPSTDYRYAVYFKSPDGLDELTVNAWDIQLGSQTYTQFITNATVTVTNAWTRYEFALPNRAYEYGLYIEATAEVLNVPTGLGTVAHLELKAAMLWEGVLANTVFNTGTVLGYDDITTWVTNLSWTSGKNKFGEPLPFEGVLDATLNNSSRIFSPNRELSPLYGYMRQNIKVKLQLKNPTTLLWETVWTGWVEKYEVDAGTTSDRRVNLRANQGMFRLREGDFNSSTFQGVRIDEVVQALVERSGWRMANSPLQTIVGYNNELGINTFCVDTTEIFSRKDRGVNYLTLVGQDWGRKTSLDKALKDILESENAQIWIDRNGQLVLVNRDFWINAREELADSLTLDTDVQEGSYVYGEDIVNAAEITLQEKKENSSAPLWETRTPVYVGRSTKRDIRIQFAYTEGRQKTVIEVSENITKTLYKTTPFALSGDPEELSSTEAENVSLKVVQNGDGGHTFRILNKNGFAIWVDASVSGTAIDVGNEEVIKVENEDAIKESGAIYREKISNSVINSDVQAIALGNTAISRNASPDGEFTSITIIHHSSVDLLRILALSIGSFLEINEYQTDEYTRYHVIIAESGRIDTAGTLEVEYTLARVDEESYAIADVTEAQPLTLQLAEELTVYPINKSHSTQERDVAGRYYDKLYGAYGVGIWILGIGKRSILDMQKSDLRPMSAPYITTGGLQRAVQASSRLLDGTEYRYNTVTITGGTYDNYNWVRPSINENASLVLEAGTTFMPTEAGALYRLYTTDANGLVIGNTYTPSSGFQTHRRLRAPATVGVAATYDSALQAIEFDSIDDNTPGKEAVGAGLKNSQAAHLTLIRMDAKHAVIIEAGVVHYFTIWAKLSEASFVDELRVDIYNQAGNITATTVFTLTNEIVKYQLAIPNTDTKVWAELRDDGASSAGVGMSFDLYAWAFTQGVAPTDFTDLNTENPDKAIIYV